MNFLRNNQSKKLVESATRRYSSPSASSSSNRNSNKENDDLDDTPKKIKYWVWLRYCGIKTLFGVPEKTETGKNKIIKKEKTIIVYAYKDASKEDIENATSINLKDGKIRDIDQNNEESPLLTDYTIDSNRTEEREQTSCVTTPCHIIYLNGPHDAECQSDDPKYYTDHEINMLIYNEERTIPPGAILTGVTSLKPDKKYLILTDPPIISKISIPFNEIKNMFTMKVGRDRYRLRNAIGIFKEEEGSRVFKFDQISLVDFSGQNIIRDLESTDFVVDKTYEGTINIPYHYTDYIKFYELPPSYDNLFKKSFFDKTFEKTFSFFKKKPVGGKKRTNKRTSKRTNKRTSKRTNKRSK